MKFSASVLATLLAVVSSVSAAAISPLSPDVSVAGTEEYTHTLERRATGDGTCRPFLNFTARCAKSLIALSPDSYLVRRPGWLHRLWYARQEHLVHCCGLRCSLRVRSFQVALILALLTRVDQVPPKSMETPTITRSAGVKSVSGDRFAR